MRTSEKYVQVERIEDTYKNSKIVRYRFSRSNNEEDLHRAFLIVVFSYHDFSIRNNSGK